MGDESHALIYLRFRFEVPGRAAGARLRIQNAGNPSADAGRICLVDEPWTETEITYGNRPAPGRELARIGRVAENDLVECVLDVDLTGRKQLGLVLDPTSTDGIDYLLREGGTPAELVIDYEPE